MFLDDEIYQDTGDDFDLFDMNKEERAELADFVNNQVVMVTVVMSLMMKICRCFTTDAHALNGQVQIMFHQHRVTIAHKYSRRSGPICVLDASNTPLECCRLFYTEQIFWDLVDYANENAKRRKESDPDNWKMLTVDELKAYYGLVIMKDIIKLDRDAHYWHQGVNTTSSTLDLEMSWVETVFQIHWYLYFVDPMVPCKCCRQTAQNFIILNNVCWNFQDEYVPHEHVTVDMAMVPFRGHLGATECICTLCLCCCALYVALSMFFCVWTSFYLSHFIFIFHKCFTFVILDITRRRGVRVREKVRGNTNSYSHIPFPKKNKRTKLEILAVAHMLLLISNLLLPLTIYIWCWWAGLEVGKPNNIPANTRWANGHSHGGHGGHSIRTPVACHSATETMQIYQRRKWVWSQWFVREAERIIVNYKREQGAAVECLLQVLAGCARREVLSCPVGKVPMPTEVLAILKETFGDQWGLSTLLTAFYSRQQGSCERVLDYTQGLVMLSTKVNEAKVGSMTISSMDHTPVFALWHSVICERSWWCYVPKGMR